MKIYAVLLTIGMLALLTSCDKEEEPPSFVHFDQVTVEPNSDASINQGSLRHRIPNAFVTIREESLNDVGQSLGYQSIPSTFPFLGTGLSTIRARPAVPINATSTSIIEYPFFEPVILEGFDLKELQVDTISLVTRYRNAEEIDILFNEDFEQNSSIFREYATPEMEGLLENQTEDVYEGTQSGRIHLDTTNLFIDVATVDVYELDLNEPYLEMDYKTDVILRFGLIGNDGGNRDFVEIGGVIPKDNWNKVYFQLRNAVSTLQAQGFETFQIYYAATIAGTGLIEADIHLDNIKLLKQK